MELEFYSYCQEVISSKERIGFNLCFRKMPVCCLADELFGTGYGHCWKHDQERADTDKLANKLL
jgi:hypothetical protein